MILPVHIYGLPVLREVAKDITPDYPNLKALIANMFETMENSDGVGLAAPQVGLPIRLLVVGLDGMSEDVPEYKDYNKAFINAHIVETDDSETAPYEEGCLSIPGLHENVTRPVRVRVRWMDEDWVEHDEWVDGFLARVLQHEIDHLDGKLFIDHLSSFRKQMIKKKLTAILNGKFNCHYRVKTK